jgi:hypothetical protein
MAIRKTPVPADAVSEDESKISLVIILDIIVCALCCGTIQIILIFSKKCRTELAVKQLSIRAEALKKYNKQLEESLR